MAWGEFLTVDPTVAMVEDLRLGSEPSSRLMVAFSRRAVNQRLLREQDAPELNKPSLGRRVSTVGCNKGWAAHEHCITPAHPSEVFQSMMFLLLSYRLLSTHSENPV